MLPQLTTIVFMFWPEHFMLRLFVTVAKDACLQVAFKMTSLALTKKFQFYSMEGFQHL
jgi:hypothetical protein